MELLLGYGPRPKRKEARSTRRRPRSVPPRGHHQGPQWQRRGPTAIPRAGDFVAHHCAEFPPAGIQEPGGPGRRAAEASGAFQSVRDPARPATKGQDRPGLGERHLPGLHRGRGPVPRVRRREALRSGGAGEPPGRRGPNSVARRGHRRPMGHRAIGELPRGLSAIQADRTAQPVRFGSRGANHRRRLEGGPALSADTARGRLVRGRLPVHGLRLDGRRLPRSLQTGNVLGWRVRMRQDHERSRRHVRLGQVDGRQPQVGSRATGRRLL